MQLPGILRNLYPLAALAKDVVRSFLVFYNMQQLDNGAEARKLVFIETFFGSWMIRIYTWTLFKPLFRVRNVRWAFCRLCGSFSPAVALCLAVKTDTMIAIAAAQRSRAATLLQEGGVPRPSKRASCAERLLGPSQEIKSKLKEEGVEFRDLRAVAAEPLGARRTWLRFIVWLCNPFPFPLPSQFPFTMGVQKLSFWAAIFDLAIYVAFFEEYGSKWNWILKVALALFTLCKFPYSLYRLTMKWNLETSGALPNPWAPRNIQQAWLQAMADGGHLNDCFEEWSFWRVYRAAASDQCLQPGLTLTPVTSGVGVADLQQQLVPGPS